MGKLLEDEAQRTATALATDPPVAVPLPGSVVRALRPPTARVMPALVGASPTKVAPSPQGREAATRLAAERAAEKTAVAAAELERKQTIQLDQQFRTMREEETALQKQTSAEEAARAKAGRRVEESAEGDELRHSTFEIQIIASKVDELEKKGADHEQILKEKRKYVTAVRDLRGMRDTAANKPAAAGSGQRRSKAPSVDIPADLVAAAVLAEPPPSGAGRFSSRLSSTERSSNAAAALEAALSQQLVLASAESSPEQTERKPRAGRRSSLANAIGNFRAPSSGRPTTSSNGAGTTSTSSSTAAASSTSTSSASNSADATVKRGSKEAAREADAPKKGRRETVDKGSKDSSIDADDSEAPQPNGEQANATAKRRGSFLLFLAQQKEQRQGLPVTEKRRGSFLAFLSGGGDAAANGSTRPPPLIDLPAKSSAGASFMQNFRRSSSKAAAADAAAPTTRFVMPHEK